MQGLDCSPILFAQGATVGRSQLIELRDVRSAVSQMRRSRKHNELIRISEAISDRLPHLSAASLHCGPTRPRVAGLTLG